MTKPIATITSPAKCPRQSGSAIVISTFCMRFAGKGLRDHPEIVAYHPRAVVVIGRSNEWDQDVHRALHGLNRRLSGIKIMTYDHLLAQGERLLDTLQSGSNETKLPTESDFEDDIPF
jgi:hypothetical protein